MDFKGPAKKIAAKILSSEYNVIEGGDRSRNVYIISDRYITMLKLSEAPIPEEKCNHLMTQDMTISDAIVMLNIMEDFPERIAMQNSYLKDLGLP